jgi:amino acid transporter
MMLGIATFGGLNSVVPVAEETKNPKKNVLLALAILAVLLGFTIILSSYAQTIIFGVNNMFNYANYPDPGILIYEKYLGGIITALYFIFIINSFNSSEVSFGTSAIRTAYGFARDGILFPKSFTKINKHKVPGNIVLFNGALSLVIALVAGILMGPFTASIFLILSNTVFSFFNHSLAGIELGVYNKRKGSLNIIKHIVVPYLTSFMLLIAIIYVVYPAPSPPLNFSAWIAGIYAILLIILYIYYKRKSPDKINSVGNFSI